jgi:hypothetical protein
VRGAPKNSAAYALACDFSAVAAYYLEKELKMNLRTPKKIAFAGGLLISISGVVSVILGAQIGAILYDVYPGGNMGHVGIIAGVGAIMVGLVIVFAVRLLFEQQKRGLIALGGILTVVLGHLGAVWGAIYVGTVGLLLCYIAGFWTLGAAIFKDRK